jgi:ubiquinone/menaquinone biosynthesis C-methylase UbiE
VKDNFSNQSALYARFRPGYPRQLFDFLLQHVPGREAAWDCGTGNGQVAKILSGFFGKVYATDLSQAQIDNAGKVDNIYYSVERAEKTAFADNSFDLVTVAQAIHWFDFESFYNEARRTLQPGGVIAVIGYDIFRINKQINVMLDTFYHETIGAYWDAERKYVDEHYRSIPFPFSEIEAPSFAMTYHWKYDQAVGYLNTLSAVQHYKRKHNEDPVEKFSGELKEAWGTPLQRKVQFPIFMRLGRK